MICKPCAAGSDMLAEYRQMAAEHRWPNGKRAKAWRKHGVFLFRHYHGKCKDCTCQHRMKEEK